MERPLIGCPKCRLPSCAYGCRAWLDYALELEKERAELSKLLIEERLFVIELGETIRDRVHAILEEEEHATEKTP